MPPEMQLAQKGECIKRFSEFLQGRFRQHFQYFGFYDLVDETIVSESPVDLNEVPSQELAVFGRAVLKHVDETRLPHFPLLQKTRVFPVPCETNLHNGEISRLS